MMHKKKNRLQTEKSPYLLQHSENPVDWFPWCEEAFLKAEKEDKPVLLSIGYATCHWCHVMERESFEDESTAEILNRDFVCIKVDREERPDIDRVYMNALHAMNQQGGWPLNMFLTPKGRPIAGGTYFPPDGRYGRRSFKEVLAVIKKAWNEQKNEINASAESLAEFLRSENSPSGNAKPDIQAFHSCFQMYEKYFDDMYFGFRTNLTNKFPPSMGISFLLFYHRKTGNEKALQMALSTLKAMFFGGIYDQIGGGLCRYSTDREWLVPHFEKMLYDNSLFIKALAEAYAVTKDELWKKAALDAIEYVERDLKLQGGGISSAEDADSEGEEGKFYIWDHDEIMNLLGSDSAVLKKYWNISEGGNFEGKNILNVSFADNSASGTEASEELKNAVQRGRKILFEKRKERIRPLRDDKVLVSWNCLYIQALAEASGAFSDESLFKKAEETYGFLKENLFREDGRLLRRYREGEAKFPAYANDYAELALAAVSLYKCSFRHQYIGDAADLAEKILDLFSSKEGPFYETGKDAEVLISRNFDSYDGVEPSANSSIARLFLILPSYGIHSDQYSDCAERIFAFFQDELENRGISYPAMLSAFLYSETDPYEIAVVGRKDDERVIRTLNLLKSEYLPDAAVCFADPDDYSAAAAAVPVLSGRNSKADYEVYFCRKGRCDLPIKDFASFEKKLNEIKNRKI
ncbi:MAG TPA: thioredoxin domain-containing protein [Leptospiraceae bacterium]|nr:thioredoxin domain-containing protein [Leptospiraceae bacterium]HMY67691.1 thioredoxin domain-containing protein [Leptospiraceae bacterium]HNF12738.1 thioredoxin domain-containing protein [Leptospiraceae bacterium]HNI94992.1 thioredoxin domain-containing protein [Leptospiraceae bacterium]HNM04625.1 thioredoxin domain-containing protein [Leptospiraceae bacterium]